MTSAAVDIIPGSLQAGVVFLCDHAQNALPARYGDLGLPAAQFARHIAYDIGAAAVTRALAARFGAPAVLTTFSRLLIDPNRGPDDPTLVMRLSDGAIVPGNAAINAAEIEFRRRTYWQPYREAVAALLDRMQAAGPVPAIVSMHSFTPFWKGVPRPWHVGVLWDADPRLAGPIIAALEREGDLRVGDNEPYDGVLEDDTLDFHASRRGLPSLLVEVRQDLIADMAGQETWADRLGRLLDPLLADPDLHTMQFFASRATGARFDGWTGAPHDGGSPK